MGSPGRGPGSDPGVPPSASPTLAGRGSVRTPGPLLAPGLGGPRPPGPLTCRLLRAGPRRCPAVPQRPRPGLLLLGKGGTGPPGLWSGAVCHGGRGRPAAGRGTSGREAGPARCAAAGQFPTWPCGPRERACREAPLAGPLLQPEWPWGHVWRPSPAPAAGGRPQRPWPRGLTPIAGPADAGPSCLRPVTACALRPAPCSEPSRGGRRLCCPEPRAGTQWGLSQEARDSPLKARPRSLLNPPEGLVGEAASALRHGGREAGAGCGAVSVAPVVAGTPGTGRGRTEVARGPCRGPESGRRWGVPPTPGQTGAGGLGTAPGRERAGPPDDPGRPRPSAQHPCLSKHASPPATSMAVPWCCASPGCHAAADAGRSGGGSDRITGQAGCGQVAGG